MTYPKLVSVRADTAYHLHLYYDNGEARLYGFTPNLSHPYYRALQNPAVFSQVSVIHGDLEWASGQDFCPFTLYEKSLPEENPAAVHRILIDGKCNTH